MMENSARNDVLTFKQFEAIGERSRIDTLA